MSDLLEQATKALRDEHSLEASSDGDLGRRRLERALRAAPKERARTRTLLLLFAATFVGAGAWAGATGRMARWIHPESERAVDRETVVETSRPPLPAPPAERPEIVPEPAPSASVPIHAAPEPAHVVESPKRATPTPPPSPEAIDVDGLYKIAHDLHFTKKDPAQAVVAWDRYLAAAGPGGALTLEARYNRGIDLAKLGRNDEARDALGPFARGEYGNYRRDDATRLMESLTK